MRNPKPFTLPRAVVRRILRSAPGRALPGDRALVTLEPGTIGFLETRLGDGEIPLGSGYQAPYNIPFGLAATAAYAVAGPPEAPDASWTGRDFDLVWHGTATATDPLEAEAELLGLDPGLAIVALKARTRAGRPLLEGTLRLAAVAAGRAVPSALLASSAPPPLVRPNGPGLDPKRGLQVVEVFSPPVLWLGEEAAIAVTVANPGEWAQEIEVVATPPLGFGVSFPRGERQRITVAPREVSRLCLPLRADRPDAVNRGEPWPVHLRITGEQLAESPVVAISIHDPAPREPTCVFMTTGTPFTGRSATGESAAITGQLSAASRPALRAGDDDLCRSLDHVAERFNAEISHFVPAATLTPFEPPPAAAASHEYAPHYPGEAPGAAPALTDRPVAPTLLALHPAPSGGDQPSPALVADALDVRAVLAGEQLHLTRISDGSPVIPEPFAVFRETDLLRPEEDERWLRNVMAALASRHQATIVICLPLSDGGAAGAANAAGDALPARFERLLSRLRDQHPNLHCTTLGEALLAWLDRFTPAPLAFVDPRFGAQEAEGGRCSLPITVLGRGIAVADEAPRTISVRLPAFVDPSPLDTVEILDGDTLLARENEPAAGWAAARLAFPYSPARAMPQLRFRPRIPPSDSPWGVPSRALSDRRREKPEPLQPPLFRLVPPHDGIYSTDLLRLLMNPIAGHAEPLGRRLHPLGVFLMGICMTEALAAEGDPDPGSEGRRVSRLALRWRHPCPEDGTVIARRTRLDTGIFAVTLYDQTGRLLCESMVWLH